MRREERRQKREREEKEMQSKLKKTKKTKKSKIGADVRRESSPKMTPPDVKKTRPQDPAIPLESSSDEESEVDEFDWDVLWGKLKTAGWRSNLAPKDLGLGHSQIFVRPGRTKKGEAGVDFFTSKEAVIDFQKSEDQKLRRSSKSGKKPLFTNRMASEFSQEAALAEGDEEEEEEDDDDEGDGDNSGIDDNDDELVEDIPKKEGATIAAVINMPPTGRITPSLPVANLDTKLSKAEKKGMPFSSPAPATGDDESASSPRDRAMIQMREINGTPVQRDDSWENVWEKMKFSGWYYHSGGKLYDFIFVLPGGRTTSEGGQAGVDFLTSWSECWEFAYTHFGWGGDEKLRKYLDLKKLEAAGLGGRRGRNSRGEGTSTTTTTMASSSSTTASSGRGKGSKREFEGREASSPSSKKRRKQEAEKEKISVRAFLEAAKQRLHTSAEASETSKRLKVRACAERNEELEVLCQAFE